MKYFLFPSVMLGMMTIASPTHAQFSSFSSSSGSCSNLCLNLDVGTSVDNFGSGFGGFNNGSVNNGLQWKAGVSWRPNAPEVTQVETERTKQRLEDNRSLTVALAEALAQNKTELARGLAILLAPRLNYSDYRVLLAELKVGAVNSVGNVSAVPIQKKVESTNVDSAIIELR
jgi:hypothetical protein